MGIRNTGKAQKYLIHQEKINCLYLNRQFPMETETEFLIGDCLVTAHPCSMVLRVKEATEESLAGGDISLKVQWFDHFT